MDATICQWVRAVAKGYGYAVKWVGDELGLFPKPRKGETAPEYPDFDVEGDPATVLEWLRWNGADVDQYRPAEGESGPQAA